MDLWEPIEAELSFDHAMWGYDLAEPFGGPYQGHVYADGVSISGDGVTWYPIWNAPHQDSGAWQRYTIDLGAAAAEAGLTLGQGFQIKFQQASYDGIPDEGRGYDEIMISTPGIPGTIEDWYRFTLDDGQSATAAVTALTRGELTLELYDAGHNRLAAGVDAENLDQAINNFQDNTSDAAPDPYFLRIVGASWTGYDLVITRQADFDTEPNGGRSSRVQQIDPSGRVLGYLGLVPGEISVGQAKLTAADAQTEDFFGHSVSISGQRAIIGAYLANGDFENAGAAYVFQFDGTQWIQQQKLTAPDADAYDWFGSSVSISGETAVVGAYGDDDAQSNAGAAYVFRFDGSRWNVQQKLIASDAADSACFGYSVSISGDTILVGAYLDDEAAAYAGAAYVFRFDGSQWLEQQKLTLADAEDYDYFGGAVSVFGDTALVGADRDNGAQNDSGAAYVFRFDGTRWQQEQKLTGNQRRFGRSVSIRGDVAMVGAGHFTPGTGETPSPSAAYVFRFDGSQWVEEQVLTASDSVGIDRYGQSVAIYGDRAVVGAPYDRTHGENAGAAYLYRFVAGRWIEVKKFAASDTAAGDLLGWSVAITGDIALVGAFADDHVHGDAGSAHVFEFLFQDEYALNVQAGDRLVVGTATPGDGPLRFVNQFDPAVELYDPDGLLVAQDDNGAPDGRNALLAHTATTTGIYSVRVLPAAGTGGEYVLSVAGHSGALPAFRVAATDPPDGGGPSAAITVHFNDSILLSTLEAADLLWDGVPAVAVTVLDANTARFDPPFGLAGEIRTATIAAGAILDLQGTPVEPFTTTLFVDTVPPRVVSSSITDGSMVQTTTSLTYTARFDKELDPTNLDPADVVLEGISTGLHVPYEMFFDRWEQMLVAHFADLPSDDYTLTLRSGDGAFEDLAGNDLDGEVNPASTVPSGDGTAGGDFVVHFVMRDCAVAGRYVFYNNSAFDGNDPAANAPDDDAIAPDKEALLPGQTATFANYTSYSRGINGIIVDVLGLPGGVTPEAHDFHFKVGNDNDTETWTTVPVTPTITVRRGAGVWQTDRVTITWPDNVIQKQWLRVMVLPTGNTGLPAADVFYFGNAVGESGNSTTDAKVNAYDMLGARDNQRTFANPAPIDLAFDYNRDAKVNGYDMLIARDNQTHFLNALKLINLWEDKAAPATSPHREAFRAEFDWLYEFEQAGTPHGAPEKDNSFQRAVDELLATQSW